MAAAGARSAADTPRVLSQVADFVVALVIGS